MKYIIIVIFSVLMILTLTKKETNTMTLTSNDTILAFGDSLTYGFGARSEENYPTQLSIVINAGVIAEISDESLKRLPQLLEERSIKLMILCFGGNNIIQNECV
jgi:lysophospholipase L1-like esterase